MSSDRDIDIDSLYHAANKIELNVFKSRAFNSICAILLSTDNHIAEAEKWITKAIETDKKYGLKLYLAIDYAQYADLFIRKGDPLKAKKHFSKAIEIFKECDADGWVEKYGKELAELS